MSRVGGVLRLFVDGNLQDSEANTTDLGTTKPLSIGATYNTTQSTDGRLDDIRIRKGAGFSSAFTKPNSDLSRSIYCFKISI